MEYKGTLKYRPSFSPIDGCGWPVVFPMVSETRIDSAQQSPLRSLLKWCFWNRNLDVFWRKLEGRKNTRKLRVKMKKWIDYRCTWKIPAIMISGLSAVLWLESGGARLGEQLSSWAEVGGSLLLGLGKTTSSTSNLPKRGATLKFVNWQLVEISVVDPVSWFFSIVL